MRHYIGIDLGTTNSAICSFDGKDVRVWKNSEQTEITPSTIIIDRQGRRYYGCKAYEKAPQYDKNSAMLFKRYLGTRQRFDFEYAGLSLTPEECSAEILKILFGYLPEAIRSEPGLGTVITVPAAFDQMKKDATLEAARLAGIGRVALIQEPVAAVMSVMRKGGQEGIFLIYDLGGGTFDISIADNIGGRVNLLAQGGKAICGGRDLDRMIFNRIIVRWLRDTFSLPDDFLANPNYKTFKLMAVHAAEKAKIKLSEQNETTIRMDKNEICCLELDGRALYIDIPITRADLNQLVSELAADTISVTKETLKKAGLSASDIERIVFVGGPTCYEPLRDMVSAELTIPACTDLNPMTAVAEGASVFAEAIDWANVRHNRKPTAHESAAGNNVSFVYALRTNASTARIEFSVTGPGELTTEVTSADTGWSSGRVALSQGTAIELPLKLSGENVFYVAVFDAFRNKLTLGESRIVITKAVAIIGAIPAPRTISVKVLDRLNGTPVLLSLVREGDSLPKKGRAILRAGKTLIAGSYNALMFNLWEGAITYPIEDNRYIGEYKISGSDFTSGIIPTGAEIICDYDINDSGNIHLCVSVPCIGVDFGDRSFYSRQEGQLDLGDTSRITDEGQKVIRRIKAMSERINDERLVWAFDKTINAISIASEVPDREDVQLAHEELLEAKKELAEARKDNLREIRQLDLDDCISCFNEAVRKYATSDEAAAFDNLTRAAQRSIDGNESDFDSRLGELRLKYVNILLRQDWYVIKLFNAMVINSYNFSDRARFETLKRAGRQCIAENKMDELHSVINELIQIQLSETASDNMLDEVNIIKG